MKTSAWQRYVPTEAEPWNLRRVVHLHRRAGFAATWDEIQRDLADGPDLAVDRILAGTSRLTGVPEDFAVMADVIGDAAVASNNPERLKAWWLYRMLFSPDPLTERLTLMWHNHFATSNLKVDDIGLMREQNELFRRHSRAPFRALLEPTIKHPAMLVWLDADANRKQQPNENLARELMELFTLGEGNYTERDVKESARALTGWTVTRGEFRFVESNHDGGPKIVLGTSGSHRGEDLIEILLRQPAASERLAWRLSVTLIGDTGPGAPALAELAHGLREHDLDIGWAVETILRSREFFGEQNIGTRVLSPVEYVIGTARMLQAFTPPPSTLLLAERIAGMGQDLFYPPNVFGWDGGKSWINTRSVIQRGNFVADFLRGELHSPPAPIDLERLAARNGIDASPATVVRWIAKLSSGQTLSEGSVAAVADAASEQPESEVSSLRAAATVLLASPRAQRG